MRTATPELYLGTSGFSFEDWKGAVYPPRLPKAQWLTFYEQQLGFNALEINYTYYQMPSHRTISGLLRKTSPAFRFAIKTNRRMTHDILGPDGSLHDDPTAFDEFRDGMRPLTESGQLSCVLAQFPYAFRNAPAHREYLDRTIDRLAGLPLVVEFRHQSWVDADVFRRLRERQVGLCAVDEPRLPRLMPWLSETTSDIGYARFHGRNAAQWFSGSGADRYNYTYSGAELQELAERLAGLHGKAGTQLVFFNNCHAGAAARNAMEFRAVLTAGAAQGRGG
jgi:uncharacterized protein YecE (DUF72 family)